MISGLAHAAVCVPDVDEAVRWYSEALGCRVLSPSYRMDGDAIERDMGELVPSPVVIKAAIVGFGQSDHVIELIQYPEARVRASEPSIVHAGLTHIGLVCDDIETTRADLEGRGVSFLTKGIADLAGLRTTWFCNPWGAVFILLEKRRDAAKPYWGQFAKN